ncbi:MAG: hypothetical protein CMN25_15395 [Salinicola sp.]|mgnify:CR=1 FL=1|uniref:hypothetical protein n=1 Tax=uncultured Salinicola sp. TaxID=1193542 RepID=UPI000C8AB690|nr:hypothetical protein [uncultured Salinicola sp.]MAM58709.1 hypothetical protein [Salinicola sp.]
MKLILKEYLASLKERGDLDQALLPNLLSAMGLQVLKTPMIGTRQDGVDISAVGQLPDDEQKYLYLLCVKAGDVGRNDWDAGPQSVGPELREILEVYIRSKIAKEHQDLPIKICLCMGGELKETVEGNWAGLTATYASEKIGFELWNGDRLAGFMEKSLLARELLDEAARRHFQKALAMVNEPEACYEYTRSFVAIVLPLEEMKDKERLLRLRQAYICLHAICAWAVEAKSLDVVYRISELGLLFCWDAMREQPVKPKPTKHQAALLAILDQYVRLYLIMSELYFEKVLYPHAETLHALTVSVKSREAVDSNLAMFDLLGRAAARAIWTDLFGKALSKANPEFARSLNDQTKKMLNMLVALLNNNPTLGSPFKDDHMIEAALVMYLAQQTSSVRRFMPWCHAMAENTSFALLTNASYPTCFRDYNDLLAHPASSEQEYRDEACVGSVLYPYLFVWLQCGAEQDLIEEFSSRISQKIPDCTHQAWFPDEETDQKVWRGDTYHGICVTGLSPARGNAEIADALNLATEECGAIFEMTAMKRGLVPLFLTACRHYRLPIPPTLWMPPRSNSDEALVEPHS